MYIKIYKLKSKVVAEQKNKPGDTLLSKQAKKRYKQMRG